MGHGHVRGSGHHLGGAPHWQGRNAATWLVSRNFIYGAARTHGGLMKAFECFFGSPHGGGPSSEFFCLLLGSIPAACCGSVQCLRLVVRREARPACFCTGFMLRS